MSGYLLSKLKGSYDFKTVLENEEELTNLVNDNQIFCNLDLKEKILISFRENPDYKLDEDSFFYIDYLKSSQQSQKIVNKIIDIFETTGSCPNLDSKDLNKIEYLLYGDKVDDNVLLNIQSVTPRFFIKSRKYLKIIDSNKIEYKNEKNVLVLRDTINLHIDKNQHRILFKNFSNLIKLHKDFIEIYREATEEEQKEFIEIINNHNLFFIDANIEIKSRNLKKLKYWLDNNILNDVFSKKNELKSYLQRYKKQLNFKEINNGKFNILNNKDFTNISKVIDECFYHSEITGRSLESNSSKIIS